MTFDELVSAIAAKRAPDAALDPALHALWLARAGDWDGAHRIASDIETTMGSRIHAHLHRVEGDLGNAAYWYRRAGVAIETDAVGAEWERLAREVTSP